MAIGIVISAKALIRGNLLLSDGMGNVEKVTEVDTVVTPGRVIVATTSPALKGSHHTYSLLPDTLVVLFKQR